MLCNVRISDEFLIYELHRFKNMYDRSPRWIDMRRKFGFPNASTYEKRFGSFNNALRIANLTVNKISDKHTGDEVCVRCGRPTTYCWRYDENENLICDACHKTEWKRAHPENIRKQNFKRKNFGFDKINTLFTGAHAHHPHLENNHDFIIYIPNFLHEMYGHSSSNIDTMTTPNAIALDFWINEEFYNDLYELNYDGNNGMQKEKEEVKVVNNGKNVNNA